MGKTRSQWLDEVRSQLGDLGHQQRITDHDVDLAIRAGLAEFAHDKPRVVTETFDGDGSAYSWTLDTAVAVAGWTQLHGVEYPSGQRTPVFVDDEDLLFNPDTLELRFLSSTPDATQSVVATYTALWPMPDDTAATDLIPEPMFLAVASLMASHALRSKAGEASRRRSKAVAGTIVTDADPDQLFRAASKLREPYDRLIRGISRDAQSGGVHLSVRSSDSYDQGSYERGIFH